MAFMLRLGRASQLLTIFCIFMLANTAESLISCYKCKTADPNDPCLRIPTQATQQKTCLGVVQKCVIRTVRNTANNQLVEFERDCDFLVPFLQDRSECKTRGTEQTCQVVCNQDRCNDVAESAVRDCVTTNCRSGATIPALMKTMLIGALFVTIKHFYL